MWTIISEHAGHRNFAAKNAGTTVWPSGLFSKRWDVDMRAVLLGKAEKAMLILSPWILLVCVALAVVAPWVAYWLVTQNDEE